MHDKKYIFRGFTLLLLYIFEKWKKNCKWISVVSMNVFFWRTNKKRWKWAREKKVCEMSMNDLCILFQRSRKCEINIGSKDFEQFGCENLEKLRKMRYFWYANFLFQFLTARRKKIKKLFPVGFFFSHLFISHLPSTKLTQYISLKMYRKEVKYQCFSLSASKQH